MASWQFMKNQHKNLIDMNNKEELILQLSKVDLSSYNLKELETSELEQILQDKGKIFENKLKSTIEDSEMRAKCRLLFYSRCREYLDDSKEEVLDYDLGYKNRKFIAFGNQQYSGTIIPNYLEELDEVSKKKEIEFDSFVGRHPVFSDPAGRLYDINYIPISLDENLLNLQRGKITTMVGEKVKNEESIEFKKEFTHFPELYQNPPEAINFTSYEQFEKALLLWSEKVEEQLGYIQLPKIMGRKYYRPQVQTKENDEKEEEFILTRKNYVETWDSQLIPIEPKPEFYLTFEEYEEAMLRWSLVCFSLPTVPPHAAQFQNLLGVSISKPPNYPMEGIEKIIRKKQKKKTVDEPTDNVIYPTAEDLWNDLNEETKTELRKTFSGLLNIRETYFAKHGKYHRVLRPTIHGKLPEDKKILGNSEPKLAKPDLDPEDMKDWITIQRSERSLKSVRDNSVHIHYALAEDLHHQKALRKYYVPHDMSKYIPSEQDQKLIDEFVKEELPLSYDCKPNIKNVTFNIPSFEIGKLHFLSLEKDGYVNFIQILLVKINTQDRNSPLLSTYFPAIPKEENKSKLETLRALLFSIQHPSQIHQKLFLKPFLTNAYIDTFSQWLNLKLKEPILYEFNGKKSLKTYVDLMNATCSLEYFQTLLFFFDNSADQLIHGKVSLYVRNFLKIKPAANVLQTIIKDKNLDVLRRIGLAVRFYGEVPSALYRYDQEMSSLLDSMMSKEELNFFDCLFTFYYLDVICVSLHEEDDAREGFKFVYPLLLDQIATLIQNIHDFLDKNPALLQETLWKIAGHKLSKISEIGMFTLNFLMFLSTNPMIGQFLTNEKIGLVTNLRTLARSKYSHVQKAVLRIFPQLRTKLWIRLLTLTYKNGQNVYDDIVISAARSSLDSHPALISVLALDFLSSEDMLKVTGELDDATRVVIDGLLESDAFKKILNEVIQTRFQKRMHQGTTQGCIFLATFLKCLLCFNMINEKVERKNLSQNSSSPTSKILGKISKGFLGVAKSSNDKKNKRKSMDMEYTQNFVKSLTICDTDLQLILDFIYEDVNASAKVYKSKVAMLKCLIHIMKIPNFANCVWETYPNFYEKLMKYCISAEDVEFNRVSWKLFYKLFKFYGQKVLDALIKKDLLTTFVKQIGESHDPTVTKNSIHYFSKIFNLPINKNEVLLQKDESDDENEENNQGDDENKKKTSKIGGNVPSDDVVKSHDKCVQNLITFIVNNKLLDSFQLAYENLSKSCAGISFQALVGLYDTIANHSSLVKLDTQFKKEKKLKEGLEKISDMVKGKDDEDINQFKIYLN